MWRLPYVAARFDVGNLIMAAATAYIVLVIRPRSRPGEHAIVLGAGIFSEPTPTLISKIPAVLDRFDAATYEAARRLAEQALRSSAYDWIGELHEEPARRVDVRALALDA